MFQSISRIPPLKVLDRVTNTIIQNWIRGPDRPLALEQGGFIETRGTGEQSFALREIACHFVDSENPFYAAFIDCKSAFDRVGRCLLQLKMHQKGIRGKLWRIICAMYKDTSASIGTYLLDVLCGVREGGISSPTLFICWLDSLVRALKNANVGVRTMHTFLCTLLFADDIVLLAESPQHLQVLLTIVWNYGKEWHFSFGTKKCEVVLGPHCPALQHKFMFGSHELKIVGIYKYLGVSETLDGHDYSTFVDSKVKSVRAKLAKTRRVGGHINGLDPYNARKLYLSQLRPIIEFGATTIPYNDTLLTKLEDMQFECLRQLFGFFPHTKKETILALVGLPRIRTRVAQLKLCFFNKLKTFDDSLYLKVLMRESFANERHSGLGRDIRAIHTEFARFPIFEQKMGVFLNVMTPTVS